MSLTVQEKNEAKLKAKNFLEKSIYTLSLLCGIDPDDAFEATSVEDLISNSSILPPFDAATTAVFQSLFNQVTSLNAIK
jgi:hypothetical protein